MGPTSTNLSYNLASRSLMSDRPLERKPNRKSKLRIAEEIHGRAKRHLSTAIFQKIVVFNYMGFSPPKMFSRSEKNICLTGLLPSISLEATEETLRKEICEVINSCSSPDLSGIELEDFEFISVHGKHAAIPQCKNGFKWNGRAAKELAGSGSIYVRLTKDYTHLHSDDDLPPGLCANSLGNGNAIAGSNDDNSVIDLDSIEELDISSSTTGSSTANPVTGSTSVALIPASIVANTTSSSTTRSYSPAMGPSLADIVPSTSNVTADSANMASSSCIMVNFSLQQAIHKMIWLSCKTCFQICPKISYNMFMVCVHVSIALLKLY